MPTGRVLRGGVLPKPTQKKGRPHLRKTKILGTIKLSAFSPSQKRINTALGTKKMLEEWEEDKKTSKGLKVV